MCSPNMKPMEMICLSEFVLKAGQFFISKFVFDTMKRITDTAVSYNRFRITEANSEGKFNCFELIFFGVVRGGKSFDSEFCVIR